MVLPEFSLQAAFSFGLLAALGAFLVWDRENVERHYILFYRRTERGLSFIDDLTAKYSGFWKQYGRASAIIGVVSIPLTFVLTAYGFSQSLNAGSNGGPSLILPGLVSQTQFNPGVSLVPVEYWVASIAVLMTVHELSHAVVARSEGFELNSVGWFVMGILPGAFVEPEGEQMLPGGSDDGEQADGGMWDQGNWKSKLKVVSAGSFANYLTAVLFIGASLLATSAVSEQTTQGYIGIEFGENSSNGNIIYEAQEGFPAAASGMTNGTIYSINGTEIDGVDDIRNISRRIEPNTNLTINTSQGVFEVETTSRQVSRLKPSLSEYSAGINWFVSLLYTVGVLNFLIGLFNMLPIKPLDGGHALESILEKLEVGRRQQILSNLSIIGWAAIIGSFVLSLL